MKIYFNANNKATLEALEQCGVKNVLLSHKYSYANVKKFRPKFDSIFMVAGTNGNPDKYHEFLKKKKEYYDYATQFDVFYKKNTGSSCYNHSPLDITSQDTQPQSIAFNSDGRKLFIMGCRISYY